MQTFQYINGLLCAEAVPLIEIEKKYGSPCYVYSRAAIETQWLSYATAFDNIPHLICYSVKANGNLAILNLLARLGSGFDIVSIGELKRVIKAGGDPTKIVFSGVGKRADEIQAALEAGVKCLNVESESELHMIDSVAIMMGVKAPISVRVNPDIDVGTHPYISTGLKESKFGISYGDAEDIYIKAAALGGIEVVGVDFHIGSQITQLEPYKDSLKRVMQLVQNLSDRGITIRYIDIGGGLGITYQSEEPPQPAEFVKSICSIIGESPLEILIEPGRSVVGNAGVLLSKVLYLKESEGNRFAIIDSAMNDLIRPALYGAWQDILPVKQEVDAKAAKYNIVGPVCESGDFLGLNRTLSIDEGDLLVIMGAGAYGFCMSSNYNARPRVAEVMVDNEEIYEIRRRESIEDLYQGEFLLP